LRRLSGIHNECPASQWVAADKSLKLDAGLEVLGLIAPKGKAVTADTLHCNRRTVAAISAG
jgi:predicted transposase YbfD/YdcC